MSPVATLKRKENADTPKQRLIKIPRPRHPRTAEALSQRREFAELMRSIKTMVQQSQ